MKKYLLILASILGFAAASAHAGEVPFPADWKNWKKHEDTRLSAKPQLPGCEMDVALFPPIYQKVIETYCNLKGGSSPGKVEILVDPAVEASYLARDGKMPDGSHLALHFRDIKLLLVTGWNGGKPGYATYTDDGKEVTNPATLQPETCRSCHTGFQSYCKNGQCGSVAK